MRTIEDVNLEGKKVLLRVDINSPVLNSEILDNDRIQVAADTIKQLKKKKAKVVIIAHQGRPEDSDYTSLEQHAKLLSRYTKVEFIKDVYGELAVNKIKNLEAGKAILLENVRSKKEEFDNSIENKFIKNLAPLFDYYINDAFSVSHREQASITGFPKVIPALAGPSLYKEIEALKKVNINDALFILGGSKAEENMLLMQGRVLTCGIFAQLCLIARGFNFGKQNEFLKDKFEVLPQLKEKIEMLEDNIKFPVDFALKVNGKRAEIEKKKFPSGYEIFDIGKKTIEIYKEEIMKARAIFMKGPSGFIEEKQFQKGTKEILNAIIKSGAYSVLGGGHLSEALKQLKISRKKFNHLSLSGGALSSYLAGKKLPGIEALEKNENCR